ncbi:M18 family aminopeptidase [Mariniluteicoccus endophyticus]
MPHAESAKHITDFAAFVQASPSSYHAAAEIARVLTESGFSQQDETRAWDVSPGGHFMVRDGAVMAWRIPKKVSVETAGFRIVGSHTDSPGFKVKPDPTYGNAGWQQVGVEVYGGALIGSWTDRELGLAGRVVTQNGDVHLVKTGPIMRIPQLAIHLNRSVNDEGLKLAKQQHTQPIFSVGRPDLHIMDVIAAYADGADLDADAIAGHDLISYDCQKPRVFGADDEFIASGRMDNLTGVHSSLIALTNTEESDDIQVMACFDHEEIGSATRSGAAGPILEDVLLRTAGALGADVDQTHRMIARSTCVSIDAGHAVHPNYAHMHDPVNRPLLNEGPLLKINANQRYATDALGSQLWRCACAMAGVPTQAFVSNNDVPCGSTIGPITATRLGITTVDVGVPLLSMHSAREMGGIDDLYFITRALQAYWQGA